VDKRIESNRNVGREGRKSKTEPRKRERNRKGFRNLRAQDDPNQERPEDLSEAVVGDETGRVKLTLWGNLAGKVKDGMVVKIENAWTSVYKGKVQLNAGSRSKINEADDGEVPPADQIPTTEPEAPYVPQRRSYGRRNYSRGFGGRRREFEEEEE
jgi:OB-fold nucleic acid binding domain.